MFSDEFQKNLNSLGEDIIKASRISYNIYEKFSRFGKTISTMLSNIDFDKIYKTLNDIAEGVIETEKDLNTFKYAMVELGYPPHHSIDIIKLRYIANDYREKGKEYVATYIDDFMGEYYDDREISGIGADWENHDFLLSRIALLRNVIMAHNLGMYHLSVATIVTQLEGVIIDAFDVKGRVDGPIVKALLGELLISEDSDLSFDDGIRLYYEQQILVPFSHGELVKSEVGRNAITHGSYTDFGKKNTSIKLILLFDYLVNSISSMPQRKKESGRIKVKRIRFSKKK